MQNVNFTTTYKLNLQTENNTTKKLFSLPSSIFQQEQIYYLPYELQIQAELNNVDKRKSHYSKETQELMSLNILHSTSIGNIAENYLNRNIIEIDISTKEYENLTRDTLTLVNKYSQMAFKHPQIAKSPSAAWCAMSMNQIAVESKVFNKDPEFTYVSQFIKAAKKDDTWKGITKENDGTLKIFNERINMIKAQSKTWKEGDFIVWKSKSYNVKTDKKGNITDLASYRGKASHIGMIEKVDYNKGIVYTIEGNAEDIPNRNAKTKSDGFIRKCYTFSELAQYGFSGTIDNSKQHKL